jgi:hypothetical protein
VKLPVGELLVQEPRLSQLFEQYPNLRARLKFIFEIATTDEDKFPSASSLRARKSQTSPEQRIAQAMRILAHDLHSKTTNLGGLKAFADLVADLSPKLSEAS